MEEKGELLHRVPNSRFNVKDEFQHLSKAELQEMYNKQASDIGVCCFNLNGDINIGMMMRTSSIMGVGQFIIMGRRKYDHLSCVGTQHHIPNDRILLIKGDQSDTLDEEGALSNLTRLQADYTIVFIEQNATAIPLNKIHTVEFNKPPLFVFGSESEGIPASIIGLKDSICVEIPQRGVGRSLNVSTACAMVLYEWFR
jgi:tRNA G18 (ribose-2'-O)-methylase SpoU